MQSDDLISQYDFHLPDERIAQFPAERRDASRLMVIDRKSGRIEHRQFSDLPELLAPGDLLVVNDTRVVPARLVGERTETGGRWEGLFLREERDGCWRIIGHTRGKLRPGERLTLLPQHSSESAPSAGESVELLLQERAADGEWLARPQTKEPTLSVLERLGTLPLPPYVDRAPEAADWDRYQTAYADRPGAVAAPTAGLHFTPEILERCRQAGIQREKVTLHVGLGTFRPVSVERLSQHQMHQEWCELPSRTVNAVAATRARKGRVVAVGTTCVRTLETVAQRGEFRPWQGETSLFIRPPFEFQIVDALLTNFHLPKSTLLVLVCTFAGRDLVLAAYQEAIREHYRFYSYGDAMLIL